MLLAQAETVGRVVDAATKSATDYGLVGILLVLVLVGIGGFVWAGCRFLAPRVSDLVASTVSLHTSIKETNIALSGTLDKVTNDHGSKLANIQELVSQIQPCPYQPTRESSLPPSPGRVSMGGAT